MSGPESRPTPPDGTPALVAAASEGEDLAQRLLSAIELVRDEAREREQKMLDEAREREQKNDARFDRLEERLEDIAGKTDLNTKNIGEQADALTRVASAAAKSADIALEAKRQAHEATNAAGTVVESALRIHNASIAATVDEAVKSALGPIQAQVKTNTDEQKQIGEALTKSNEAIGAIVNELGIEDRVALGRDVKPGEQKPTPTLAKLDHRAKNSTIVQLILALLVLLDAIVSHWPQH